MNRRKKKVQQVDYLQLFKDKVESIDLSQQREKLTAIWQQLPKLHQRVLMVLVPLVILLALIPFPEQQMTEDAPLEQRIVIDINTQGMSEQNTESPIGNEQSDAWKEYTVQRGDTLAQVFRNNGLPMADLNALVKVEGSDKPLSYIKQGQLVRFKLKPDGELDILQLEKSDKSVMFFRIADGTFGRSK